MRYTITKLYRFEAAHRLPRVPAGHPCGRLHGHSYQLILEFVGTPDPEHGWFLDYGDIDSLISPLIESFDHHDLNSILENPTAENLAAYVCDRIRTNPLTRLLGAELSKVTIKETEKTSASVEVVRP